MRHLAALFLSLIAMPAFAADLTVNALYRERIATPPGSTFKAEILDVSRADAPATVMGRAEAMTVQAGPPFRIVVPHDPAAREPGGRYVVRAELRLPDGALFFTTDMFIEAPAESGEIDLMMVRVAAQPEPAPMTPANLVGPRWALIEIGGLPAPAGSKAHMMFDGERLSGNAGCNRMGAGYIARPDGAFLAGLAMSTMMACPEPAMRTERAVFDALEAARGWAVSGDRLTLRDARGALLVAFAATEAE